MVCKQCGKKLKDGETICAHCGAKVSKRKKLGSAGKRRRKRQVQRMRAIIVCAAAAVAIVVAIIGIRAVWNSKDLGRDTQTSEKEVSEANDRLGNVLSRFIGSVSVNVGDTLTLGSYEQDGDFSNGSEPIEWEVLDVQSNKALVISRYVLECVKYHYNQERCTWETCTLREWLNGMFYGIAFSDEDKEAILDTQIETYGVGTEDKLFVLDPFEIRNYYPNDYIGNDKNSLEFYSERLIVDATRHAVVNGVSVSAIHADQYHNSHGYGPNDETLEELGYSSACIGRIGCRWWLRTSSTHENMGPPFAEYGQPYTMANVVSEYGQAYDRSSSVVLDGCGVRPTMWVHTDKIVDNVVSHNTSEKTFDAEIIRSAGVGDVIRFGSYEQDNNAENGEEELEWYVLNDQGDKILVISRYVLDAIPYNTEDEETDWESCSLRAWLNDDFIEAAFSDLEKSHISEVQNNNTDIDSRLEVRVEKDTVDHVFCLNVNDVLRYCQINKSLNKGSGYSEVLMAAATPFAAAKGALQYDSVSEQTQRHFQYSENSIGRMTSIYWLRTNGHDRWTYSALVVGFDGSYGIERDNVAADYIGVRPVMWLSRN